MNAYKMVEIKKSCVYSTVRICAFVICLEHNSEMAGVTDNRVHKLFEYVNDIKQ